MFARMLGLAIVELAICAVGLEADDRAKTKETAAIPKEQIPTPPAKILQEQIATLPAKIVKEQIPTLPAKVLKDQIPIEPAKDKLKEQIPTPPAKKLELPKNGKDDYLPNRKTEEKKDKS